MAGEVDRQEFEQVKDMVVEMKEKLDSVYDVIFGDENDVDTRAGIDDIRLIRQIWRRFKSVRFFFGAIVGCVTVLASAGYAIIKLIELVKMIFETKGG